MKFPAGDFCLDDVPWSGRPAEVDSNQIETLIENNQHSTTWEIADILKIATSIKLLVEMKIVSFILWKKKHSDFLASPIFSIKKNHFFIQCKGVVHTIPY